MFWLKFAALGARKPRKIRAPGKVGRCCGAAGGTKTTQNTCSGEGWALLWRCWGQEDHAKYVLRGRLGVAVALLGARKPRKIRAPGKVVRCCGAAGGTNTTQNMCSGE